MASFSHQVLKITINRRTEQTFVFPPIIPESVVAGRNWLVKLRMDRQRSLNSPAQRESLPRLGWKPRQTDTLSRRSRATHGNDLIKLKLKLRSSATGSTPGKTPAVPESDGRGPWSACRSPSTWSASQPCCTGVLVRAALTCRGQRPAWPCMSCTAWVRF